MRRTRSGVAVLSALDTVRWRYAGELVVVAGVDPRTAGRVLRVLEEAGLAVSVLEDAAEADFGRKGGMARNRGRRRYYRLTPAGVVQREVW